MLQTAEPKTRQEISIIGQSREELLELNDRFKLSLLSGDLDAIQMYFGDLGREPSRVELEVIAQSWSEHCKHRVFNAEIEHEVDGKLETIDGIFDTFVRSVTEQAVEEKPDFVPSAFVDNAGFIRLSDEMALCIKVETHNHPSALEPYAGANTGLGGVIRDILGAGKGAKPVASLDVFCLGDPDCQQSLLSEDVIHPARVFRGVVAGVRDYGNRMGIPTVAGALHFNAGFTYNPLVFCGTVGIIPLDQIEKVVKPGQELFVIGGRTGRDGLHGATFSSASLDEDSHADDVQAVQIGNPIEQKKMSDFLLHAREEGLLECVTDCGAGGLSSAVGEMCAENGAEIDLEKVPLKQENMVPWEIFLSESQERMVVSVDPESVDRFVEMASWYQTNCDLIGRVTDTGQLVVKDRGQSVCELEMDFIHSAPKRQLRSEWSSSRTSTWLGLSVTPPPAKTLKEMLSDINQSSREPVIRQYDFEVQGNTLLKPLNGEPGDVHEDGVGIGSNHGTFTMGVSILPEYGKHNPYRMGQSTVDEAVRQVVSSGTNPEKIGLLDNFCLGDPEDPEQLGELVETARGMADVAREYGLPFVSGKDSFHNSYESPSGQKTSIPTTLLVTALGLVEREEHLVSSSLRRSDSVLCLCGETRAELGGSSYHSAVGVFGGAPPSVNPETVFKTYRKFHECVNEDLVLSAHDLSQGGLAVAVSEMGFSLTAGVELSIRDVLHEKGMTAEEVFFSESNGRILFEVSPENMKAVQKKFQKLPLAIVGKTSDDHKNLRVSLDGNTWLDEPLKELKTRWKKPLEPYC